MDRAEIEKVIIGLLADLTETPGSEIGADTPLIGEGAIIKSRSLVELLLSLEEFAEDELGARFDWTSDSALSPTRSMMRTVGTLTDALAALRKS